MRNDFETFMKTSSLHFLCWLKENEAKERAFRGGGKNPVHYARQLAERRNPLRSHRSTPLPCYGRRIFSVTPQVGEMTYSNREIQRIQLWQDATVSSEVPPCNLLFSFLCFVSFFFSGRRKKERNEGKNFYYHTNHLGSTAFVTDQNQTVTQGFLYAPFGEITTEYAPSWQNGTLPKYSFNAKELDEETGMYYYEARYYKPPVFTSRDPMYEKYFWMSPYAYCANNPVKYVDPSGEEMWQPEITENGEVNYVAEKGDSKESFKSQYGLSEAEASDIFKVANLPQQGKISNGTKISSKDVKKVTGSEVLKLDWNSTKATPQRKVYHIGFAHLYENLHGNGHFALNKYFYNMPQSTGDQSNRNFHGNLRIPIKGGSIPICNLNMSASGKTILYMDGLFKQNDRGDMNQFYNVFNPNGKNMKQQLGNLPMLLITIPLEYSDVFDNNYRR